jgi:adenosine deaminase
MISRGDTPPGKQGIGKAGDDEAGRDAEVACEAQAEAARLGNLRYREISFNPTNHPSMTYKQQLDAILDGLADAGKDFGVVERLIPAINREQPASVATDLVADVITHRRDEVVGIGLDHDDSAGPAPMFAEAYALAGRNGRRRTAHASEVHTPSQITDSLDVAVTASTMVTSRWPTPRSWAASAARALTSPHAGALSVTWG